MRPHARAAALREAISARGAGVFLAVPRGMKAVLLSAAPTLHASMNELEAVLHAELARTGYAEAPTFHLATMKLAFCQGELDCWLKTPGCCKTEDAEAEIVAAVHGADAIVLLGPVTFGGHGYVLKRALDRLICLVEPFFEKRRSLTHHPPRYLRPPSFFSVGWLPEPDAALTRTFVDLNDANALNMSAPACGALVLSAAHRNEWAGAIGVMLEAARPPGAGIAGREPLREALFATAAPDANAWEPARVGRAAILVGSAKPKGTSASEALARAFAKRLEGAGVATDLHFATEFVHEDEQALARAGAIAASDLFLLVTPLYVDSLPALATHALELVARSRSASRVPARFVALVQCGFPEAEQNRTALRITRHFAEQAGYSWGGALALGAGGAVAPGAMLDEASGPVAHVVRALDTAAPALSAGRPLPPEAIAEMARAPIPDALYRRMGDLGFRWQAHKNGLPQSALHARPLDER